MPYGAFGRERAKINLHLGTMVGKGLSNVVHIYIIHVKTTQVTVISHATFNEHHYGIKLLFDETLAIKNLAKCIVILLQIYDL